MWWVKMQGVFLNSLIQPICRHCSRTNSQGHAYKRWTHIHTCTHIHTHIHTHTHTHTYTLRYTHIHTSYIDTQTIITCFQWVNGASGPVERTTGSYHTCTHTWIHILVHEHTTSPPTHSYTLLHVVTSTHSHTHTPTSTTPPHTNTPTSTTPPHTHTLTHQHTHTHTHTNARERSPCQQTVYRIRSRLQ